MDRFTKLYIQRSISRLVLSLSIAGIVYFWPKEIYTDSIPRDIKKSQLEINTNNFSPIISTNSTYSTFSRKY